MRGKEIGYEISRSRIRIGAGKGIKNGQFRQIGGVKDFVTVHQFSTDRYLLPIGSLARRFAEQIQRKAIPDIRGTGVFKSEENHLRAIGTKRNTSERIAAVAVEGYPFVRRNSGLRCCIFPGRTLCDIARGDIQAAGGDRADSAGGRGIEPCKRRPDQHDCTQKHAENADAQRAVQAGFLWLAVPRAEPVRTIHFHNGTSFLVI